MDAGVVQLLMTARPGTSDQLRNVGATCWLVIGFNETAGRLIFIFSSFLSFCGQLPA